MAHERPAPAPERDDALDEPPVHLPDAREDGEEDQHGHQDEGEGDLRGDADAEPDDEERRQDDARDGVEQRHHRLEQLRDQRDERGENAQHDAGDDAEGKSGERGRERRLDMNPNAAASEQLDERGADLARAWRIERVEQPGATRRLPDRQKDGKRRQLTRPDVSLTHGRRSTSRAGRLRHSRD